MSHPTNDQLYDLWMDTLELRNVCPYCGDHKEQGAPCCHEVHDETVWDNGEEYLEESQLESAFQAWLAKRGDA